MKCWGAGRRGRENEEEEDGEDQEEDKGVSCVGIWGGDELGPNPTGTCRGWEGQTSGIIFS